MPFSYCKKALNPFCNNFNNLQWFQKLSIKSLSYVYL